MNWWSSFIWLLSGALLAEAILGKLLTGFLLKGETFLITLAIGVAMIPPGEVGLIFAKVGQNPKVLTDELYASLILPIL